MPRFDFAPHDAITENGEELLMIDTSRPRVTSCLDQESKVLPVAKKLAG